MDCDRAIQLSIGVVLPFVVVLVLRHAVPPNFYFDSLHLHQLVHSSLQPDLFNSFVNLSWLVGLFSQSAVPDDVVDIAFGVIACVLFAQTLLAYQVEFDLATLTLTVVFGLVYYLYLTQLSKELLVLLFLAACVSQLKRHRWLTALGILILYALFARSYWLLITAVWVVLEGTVRVFGLRLVTSAAAAAISVAGLLYGFELLNGYPLLSIRDTVNANREIDQVTTAFPFTLSANASFREQLEMYGFSVFWYGLPVWMLKTGSIKLIAAFLVQLAITVVLIKAFFRSTRVRTRWSTRTSAVNLLVAIYCVLLIFEPDAGSFLKHQAPLLPLIMGLAYGRI